MKTISKVAGCLAVFLLAGMTLMLVRQQQALDRLRGQNRSLQQQVDGLTTQADQLAEEKERLSRLAAAQEAKAGIPLAREQFSELLRLRGKVGSLRLQEREIEQSRRERMQAAQEKLTNAEVDLARLTKAHSENLVSSAELTNAWFTVELLKAEARGDTASAAQVRLQQAAEELARASELRSQSLISQTEYDQALRKVESLRAGADR